MVPTLVIATIAVVGALIFIPRPMDYVIAIVKKAYNKLRKG